MAAHDGEGDLRWALTEEELEWCAALVAALAAEGTARPRPDLLLAQFAIVGKGDTEKTVECVNNYNRVIVDEYGYTFAANHGYAWNFWNRKWPGTYLPALPQHGKSCIVNDFHTYRPADLADDEFGLLVTDHLVMCEACNHDLEQIRTGSVFLTHCSELGWGNFSVDLQKRWNALHDNCYPVWFGRVLLVDANWVVAAMLKICKVFMSKKMADQLLISSQDALYDTHGYDRDGLPPVLGGAYTGDYVEDWLKPKLALRAESVRRVMVP